MVHPKCFIFLVPALCVGCASPSWNRKVQRWGSLKEVLRNGQTEGRVKVSRFSQTPETVGLGVLKELKGEVTIVGGKVWISTVVDGAVVTKAATLDSKVEAAFLVTSNVRAWREIIINDSMNLEGLQKFIESKLATTKLADSKTIPFVVTGSFDELSAHVVNGGCPFAADEALRKEPIREQRSKVAGTLIGFITSLPPGTMTHHGSKLHVHGAIEGPAPYAGHLDAALIPKGSRLLVPVLE